MTKTQGQRPTIRTVAEDAGVSRSAVSKVLCNAYGVSPDLRARVMASIERLDYRPQTSARAMRGRAYTLGVLASDIRNPFFADVFVGISRTLADTNFQPLLGISQSSDANESSLVEAMLDRQVDGLIWIAPRVNSEVLRAVARRVPAVVVAYHEAASENFDTVNVDDEMGARLAVEHLHAMGLGRIGMVSVTWPDTAGAVTHLRERGYRQAMMELGLQQHARVVHTEESAVDVSALTADLLRQTDRPEALFCWNDFAALEVLSESMRLGFAVPGDLAIVGFDNTAFCRLEQNSLTSIDQSAEVLGENAARLLLERVDGRSVAQHILVEPALKVRRSSSYKT
jgi:DNA-binding LacI/PurR family transcriptional regulator